MHPFSPIEPCERLKHLRDAVVWRQQGRAERVDALGLRPASQTGFPFYTGDTFTHLLGINNSNVIAGYHGATVNKGFTYSRREQDLAVH